MIRYFISDLHLSDKRPDLIQAFVRLLDTLPRDGDDRVALYILGDFYEAWIGDDYQPDWNEPIEQALHTFSNAGNTLYFLHGNRDFLIGSKWSRRVGATLLPEKTVISYQNSPILLAHGDEFCQEDIEYQKFRSMVRTQQWQNQILSMPLEKRLTLATQLRNDSKSMAKEKSMEIMDVTEPCVAKELQEHNSHMIIHGHTHRPEFHQYEHYVRCVLGDWDDCVWLAILNENGFTQLKSAVEVFINQGTKALKEVHHLGAASLLYSKPSPTKE